MLTRALVTKILVDGGTAVGIVVSQHGQTHTVRCDREVLLCAGAVNSPKLLMLSGVGPADELRRCSIEVIADVPEVGRNLPSAA